MLNQFRYYLTTFPDKNVAAGIDTVIMTFANSSLFNNPAGNYTPFEPVSTMRARFAQPVKVLMAIGGWGDTIGFGIGTATPESRAAYAKNVADTVERLGFDGVDVDWEYPGGNGDDYKINTNDKKVSEIETFPLFLEELRCALGDKLLSAAVPGKNVDMIAYTPEKAPLIWASLDFVNIMTYDLFNRRDTVAAHHTSVVESLEVISYYLDILALPPAKANLGFAFYAKWADIDPSVPCEKGLGCKTVLMEDPATGAGTGHSGTVTYEIANYVVPNTGNLTVSPDASCGAAAGFKCKPGDCCSQYNFCGNTADHCGASCQPAFGTCNDTSVVPITTRFQYAIANITIDEASGGAYYYDKSAHIFWTWDTPELITRKFEQIVKAKGLGGVMAWSLTQDSHDWSHILAIQAGVRALWAS